jgi:hypothetical protein
VGPLSGVLVDLYPKRRILLLCQSVTAVLATTLAVLDAGGGISVLAVYACCVALGITSAWTALPARSLSTRWWGTPACVRRSA